MTVAYELLTTNLRGKVREERLNGRSYLVAPMRLIVPGVLPGSEGPLYYPPEEVGRYPEMWDGMPLTLGHPTRNGKPVKARDPKVLERVGLGWVFNTGFDGNLDAEGWFDVEHTKVRAPRVYQALKSGTPLELSTGLFLQKRRVRGATHNGRPYDATTHGYRPDHVAVLLDEQGACSLEDGCGVLINARGDGWEQGTNTNTGDDMAFDKAEAVEFITTNCDCWKDKADTLNKMDDDSLKAIKAGIERNLEQQELIDNVRGELGITEDDDVVATVKAKVTANADKGKGKAKPAANKGKKIPMNPKQAMGADDEDEDEGKPSNAKTPTFQELYEAADEETKAAIENSKQIVAKEKTRIIGLLTANVTDKDKKKAAVAAYQKMSLPDLQALEVTANGKTAPAGGKGKQDPPVDNGTDYGGKGLFLGNRAKPIDEDDDDLLCSVPTANNLGLDDEDEDSDADEE